MQPITYLQLVSYTICYLSIISLHIKNLQLSYKSRGKGRCNNSHTNKYKGTSYVLHIETWKSINM
jgi:hypothetical protein